MDITIHTYRFNTETPEGREGWTAFQEARKAEGLRVFSTYGPDRREERDRNYLKALDAINGKPVPLDTAHIFNNQLNTGPIPGVSESGLRVFDWKHDIWPNRRIQSGHYIEQTEELRELRRNTCVCGYCGKQEPAAKGYVFCPHCLDSEYLKPADLKLTRMRPVCEETPRNARPELTNAEREHLLPLYREAQLHGTHGSWRTWSRKEENKT